MHRLLVVSLITAVFAGCAADAPDEEPHVDPPMLDDAMAARLAGADSANLAPVFAWPSGSEEADAWQDLLFIDRGSAIHIMRYEYENIVEVGQTEGVGAKDVKVSDDGKWIFVGNDDRGDGAHDVLGRFGGGFYVFNVEDPQNPELVSHLPVGPTRGPHMVFYYQKGGDELVFGANGDISINRFDRSTGTLTELSRYTPNYVTDVDRHPDRLDAYYQVYAHDMFVMDDPVTNRSTMYVANWDAGLHVVDVEDPASPKRLGMWNDFPDGHSGNLHTVATEWIGDRRITVGSVEVGFSVVGGVPYALDQDISAVYIWDTTDPAAIKLLSVWENPEGLSAGQTVLGEGVRSSHNFQLEGGIIYLAHYELGTFILDARTPELQAKPGLLAFVDQDGHSVWDVIIAGGTVVTSGSGGVFGYDFPLLTRGADGLFSRA